MYQSYFKLHSDPFVISPDPRYLYPAPWHGEALAGLTYGVQSHKGLLALTGDVGMGKTLMLRCLLETLPQERTACAFVCSTFSTGAEFLGAAVTSLGFPFDAAAPSELLPKLGDLLLRRRQRGLTTVLVVDEAQQLPLCVLDDVRMLTNLETPQGKLLQIILAGQPELDARLELPETRALKQRIAMRFRLRGLTEEQTGSYIQHRLRVAGAKEPIFSLAAVHRVFVHSRGIPRVINLLCEHALISTFALERARVSAELVDEAAADLCLGHEEVSPGSPAVVTERRKNDPPQAGAAGVLLHSEPEGLGGAPSLLPSEVRK